jgi:hypothetical protein
VLKHDLEFQGMPVSAFVAEDLRDSLTMVSNLKRFLLIIKNTPTAPMRWYGSTHYRKIFWQCRMSGNPRTARTMSLLPRVHQNIARQIGLKDSDEVITGA